jgi:very-short-patch-repair endonuclease
MHYQRARKLRKNLTEAEQRLWRSLRLRQVAGVKFRRQQPVGPFIVDFVCFELRLIVEVDGGQHSENAYDESRSRWLETQGYAVVRFWNNEVLANTDAVLRSIFHRVEQRKIPPP